MIEVMVVLFGLAIGSFLNVCIYRIPEGMSIVKPNSRCGHCGHALKTLDLVPVCSWISLRGKCRYCGDKISVRYPIVELLTALMFLFVFLEFGISMITLFNWILTGILITVFFTDLDHMIIPNKVILFGLVSGAFVAGYHYSYGYEFYYGSGDFHGFIGMICASAILYLIALITKLIYGNEGGIGMGDVKLFMVIGLYVGWSYSLLILWLTFIIGGVFGVILLFLFKKDRKQAIPFAPFIVISTFICLFFGDELILRLFNL